MAETKIIARNGLANMNRLLGFFARSIHHDQQVYITFRARPAVSIRTEQDDLVRRILRGDLLNDGLDGAAWNAAALVDIGNNHNAHGGLQIRLMNQLYCECCAGE